MPKSEAFCMDCMEAMKQFPDKYFDLAVVDPPYGINADNFKNGAGSKDHPKGSTANNLAKGRLNSGGGKLKNRILNRSDCSWDRNPPSDEYFKQLFRVSKNQVIWGGNYFNLPPTRGIAVWDKMQPWENFSQVELAWTSFDKPAALFRFCNAGGASGTQKIHPCQKPIELYHWIYSHYAKNGDKILDTHMGAQSSRIAAYDAGLDYTGYEIDETYFKLGCERFERHTAQMNLFLEET